MPRSVRRPRPAAAPILASVLLLAAAGAAVAGPPPVEPGELLGSTGNAGNSLISIDPVTGAGTLRFAIGSFGPVTEIEHRSDGVLFGSTGGGSSNIITIDPDTGVETLVGMHAFGAVNGLEFVGDTLYGAYIGKFPGSALVIVDQTDGSLTPVAMIDGYAPVRGLAYDPDTGTMYGVGSPIVAGGVPGGGDELFTVDLADGAATPIGPTGFIILGGLEFGSNGVLYGGIAIAGGQQPEGPPGGADGDLVTVSTTTGAATPVGPTGSSAISGLSFVPGVDQGPSVLEIPTASGLGLALLALALAAGGLLAIRRG